MVAMREGARDIRLRYSKPDCAETLTYTYDSEYIKIDSETNRIIALKEGHTVEVTASSEHFYAEFTVYTDYIYYAPVINAIPSKKDLQRNRDLTNATVFIGDSFFDPSGFWTNFYNDVKAVDESKPVFLTGISSSTIKDWFCISDVLLYQSPYIKDPENIVIHLGSNDLWYNTDADGSIFRLKELVTDLKYHYPETSIYFISTENRTYAQVREHWDYRTHNSSKDVRLTMEESKNELLKFREQAKQYCEETNDVYFIDSLPHFTNSDFSCNSSMFKDGCHPNNDQYKFYINALIANGLDEIYNPYSYNASKNQDINETCITYKPNATDLIKDCYVEFDLTITERNDNKQNMFVDFAFDDAGNRFLIWKFNNDDNYYLCGALDDNYYQSTNQSIVYNNSKGTVKNKIGILMSTRNIYLFLNDNLTLAFLNINNTKAMKTQSCWISETLTNPVVYDEYNGNDKYLNMLNKVNDYENSESQIKEYKAF